MTNSEAIIASIQFDEVDTGLGNIQTSLRESHQIVEELISSLNEISKLLDDIAINLSSLISSNDLTDIIATTSNICTILQTLTTLFGTLTWAKLQSKAEDLAIIALYAVDYVKAFGVMIAQMAINTASWIANTAAKVASTAAEWAQIAATTAWNAICAVATTVTTAFGAAVAFLTSPIGLVILAIVALIAVVAFLIANWDTVAAKAAEVWGIVKAKFAEFGEFLNNVFAKDWTEQFGAFGHIMNAFFANVQNIWEAVKQIFTGVVDFVKSIFAGDWKAAWDSVIEIFGGIWDGMLAYVKMPINGIIGLINLLIRGAMDGINAVIGLINNLQFDIPDWIPKIGGTTFGFNIAPITAPQIPYLAQGAVLPANKPFLAMVGDQKHGTNVEAPLATIQEALANVLAQQGMGGDIHITFTGDLAQLGRVLKPVIERENRRVGTSLVKGVM